MSILDVITAFVEAVIVREMAGYYRDAGLQATRLTMNDFGYVVVEWSRR